MNWKAGFSYLCLGAWRFARRRPVVSAAIGLWSLLLIGNVINGIFDLGLRHTSAPVSTTAAVSRPMPAQTKPGPAVFNSPWDGSVHQVERYLELNLKDPDSFEAIEWSNVHHTGDGYTVRCKYRARNGFGGMTIENQLFRLSRDGDVLSHVALKP